MNPARKKNLVRAAKLLVACALMWGVYRKMNAAAFLDRISGANPLLLAAFFALLFFNTFISSLKWGILLRADSVRVPLSKLFVSYMIGTFFNLFMPSNIGGDAYRVYAVARGEAKLARSFSSVLADRISGFMALAIIGLAAAVAGMKNMGDPRLALVPLLLLAVLAAATAAAFNPGLARRMMALSRMNRIAKLNDFAERCLAAFAAYRARGLVLAQVMAISFAFQLVVIVCIMILARAIGLEVNAGLFFIYVPLISILEAIPVSIYGLGLRDFGYAMFFRHAGTPDPAANALAISLLYLAATVAYSSIGGAFFLWRLYGPCGVKKIAPPAPGD